MTSPQSPVIPAVKSGPLPWRFALAIAVQQTMAGVCYPIAKYGLSIIEPFTFAFYRFCLSSVVLLAIVFIRPREPKIARTDLWKIAGLGFAVIPVNQTLFLVGQSLTGAGHGALLFSTAPVWIFILAVIHLKERAPWRRLVGILTAVAGVTTIMWSGLADFGSEYLLGDLIIVVSVVAWGYYTVLGKPLVEKYGALRVTAYALAFGSAMYLPFGAWFALKYDYSQATLGAWGSVVYMALGLSVIVYVLWYWLLKHLDASRIAIYHNIQPILASTVAYLFLGEALSSAFLVGGVIVILGVLIAEW
jgi:drug/metabolite transporter (DMT)-like permease